MVEMESPRWWVLGGGARGRWWGPRAEPSWMGLAPLEKARKQARFLSATARQRRSRLSATCKVLCSPEPGCAGTFVSDSQPPAPWERNVSLLKPTVGLKWFVIAAPDGWRTHHERPETEPGWQRPTAKCRRQGPQPWTLHRRANRKVRIICAQTWQPKQRAFCTVRGGYILALLSCAPSGPSKVRNKKKRSYFRDSPRKILTPPPPAPAYWWKTSKSSQRDKEGATNKTQHTSQRYPPSRTNVFLKVLCFLIGWK